MYLSKSRYCSAVQCPKILWMHKNMPDQYDDSVMDMVRLTAGNQVGDLAMGYFGDFIEIPYLDNKVEMLRETKRL